MTKYRFDRRSDGWWIVGDNRDSGNEFGPYGTKVEAAEDRRGLLAYEREAAKGARALRKFVTCETEKGSNQCQPR